MKYEIKVSLTENRYDGTGHSNEVLSGFDGILFDSKEEAIEKAESIDLKDYLSDLLTDFKGVSGSVDVSVIGCDEGGDEIEFIDLDGAMLTFERVDYESTKCKVFFDGEFQFIEDQKKGATRPA